MKALTGTDYLVLWKYSEALNVNGYVMTGARGTHAGGLKRGDRMFVVATHRDELYLLGAMTVVRSGKDWADAKSLFGAFRIIPMKALKWRLRFEATPAVKLSRSNSIAWQVRSRRRLSPKSAEFLERLLAIAVERAQRVRVQEGNVKQMLLSKRERNRELRILAIAERGAVCEICRFDFAKKYGEFATNCVELHHIEALAGAGRNGVTNSLDDVLVVCPNCHRALHRFRNPKDWQAFRSFCRLC